MTESIYRSETLLARVAAAADSDVWFVTFEHHCANAGLDRTAFAEGFLNSEGFSAIHVIGRGNDWYQYADLCDALRAVREYLIDAGAKRIVTYGSSMGGYAAIRCADFIGAQVALALSPQYSNDPRVTPWERRWLDDAHRIRWLPDLKASPKLPAHSLVIFDPVEDGRHAALIASHFPATLIPIRYAGHPVATFLNQIGLLRVLVTEVGQNLFQPEAFKRAVRSRRAGSSVYLSHLAIAQPPRRADRAMALARRARALEPTSTYAMQVHGMALSRAGRHEPAITVLEEAVRLSDGQDLNHLYWLAEGYKAARRYREALAPMARAVKLAPDQAHLWVWHAYTLARVGDLNAAIERQTVAIGLAPKTSAYRSRRWKFRVLLVLSKARRLIRSSLARAVSIRSSG